VYYREWSPRLNARKGDMVSLDELDRIVQYARDPGFASVYAFNKADAEEIRSSGCSKGFDKYTPCSDTLPIDLDTGDSYLKEVLDKLSPYSYKLYSSGGKGYHIVLNHEFISSKDLPVSHARFVEDMQIPCDMTLYQAGRILALPGRVHSRTGKKKVLIEDHEGENIKVHLAPKLSAVFDFTTKDGDISGALGKLWSLSILQAEVGQRHMKLWGMSMDMAKAGFDAESVYGMLLTINNSWKNPLSEEEVRAAVLQAYRRVYG
jgi:hypothetical protein